MEERERFLEEVGETVGGKTDLNTKHNSLGSLPSSLVHFLHQRADQSRYDPMQVTVQGFTYIRSIVDESQVKYGSEKQKINVYIVLGGEMGWALAIVVYSKKRMWKWKRKKGKRKRP